MRVQSILQQLRDEWALPRTAIHEGEPVPVPLKCSFMQPANDVEIEGAACGLALPAALIDLWRFSSGAMLFEDETYGQWGLRVFSPSDATRATAKHAADRPDQFKPGDLVLGEFLGDSDLLVIRCDGSASDYGSLVVALPLDERSDWDAAAPSLEEFLEAYVTAHGDKFWRRSGAR